MEKDIENWPVKYKHIPHSAVRAGEEGASKSRFGFGFFLLVKDVATSLENQPKSASIVK